MSKDFNQIGQVFDVNKAVCRDFDVQQIHKYIAGSGMNRAWSWGFRKPQILIKNKAYRFRVNGHHHKGHVTIVLDFMDTFTIYYTGLINGVISKISESVYIDELIERIDIDVERIDEYYS